MAFGELFRQFAFLADGNGAVLAANRPAREKFGEVRHLQDVLDAPPNSLSEFLRRCARTRTRCVGAFSTREGRRYQVEGCMIRPREGDNPAVLAIRFLSDTDAGTGFRVLNHNLKAMRAQMAARSRAQAALKREREWLRVTLMSIGDGVIATDLEGRVELMNPVAESLTGWKQAESLGQPLNDILRLEHEGDEQKVENPVSEVLRDGEPASLPRHTVLVSRDGTRWSIEDTATPIRDEHGTMIGSALVFREVGERRRLEQIANARMAELADASRRKDEFLAMLAHELRNPLAPILTAATILKSEPSSRASIEWTAQMIERQTLHMVRLVDDLLDLSRVTQGKITLRREKVEIAAILRHAANTTRGVIDSKDHQIDLSIPEHLAVVDADPTRLEQVFVNLLHNAVKYSPTRDAIVVSAEVEDDFVVVSVLDRGIGIPAELLEHVFDLFTQGDRPLDRAQGGLGIGLTLVKQLVALHGGTVSAHSAGPGTGSEFRVRLPISAAKVDAPTVDADRSSRAPRLRVLVVDDNEDAAESLALLLSTMGHKTTVANSGTAAILSAERDRPDLILLDIGLPDMDGYETAQRLSESPRTREIACIALTGYGQEQHRQRSLELGFKAHLTKPVEPATLGRILADWPHVGVAAR